MKRPSGDQSFAKLGRSDYGNVSSLPAPFDSFGQRLICPARFEEKAMRVPSGDHTGETSLAGSNVNRERLPPPSSINQISSLLLCASRRASATRLSSGESLI